MAISDDADLRKAIAWEMRPMPTALEIFEAAHARGELTPAFVVFDADGKARLDFGSQASPDRDKPPHPGR